MSAPGSAVSTEILSGRRVAEAMNVETVQRWKSKKRPQDPVPGLASVAVGEGSPFHLYQRQQRRAAEKLGLAFKGIVLPQRTTPEELHRVVNDLNKDPTVHGIILQHPLPSPLDFFSVMSMVEPAKDIDGVGAVNLGRLLSRRPMHVPAVALAARDILRSYRVQISGEPVVVVGRSETVGLPTALLLLMKGEPGDATVTVAHSRSKDLDGIISRGKVLISCAGVPGLLHRKNVAAGTTVIDVGLSTVPDASAPGGTRMAGDTVGLEGWAAALTPVPGGVGPVTVSELLRSTVMGWELTLGLSEAP